MKRETKGLGQFVFMEWIIPVLDYFRSLRKNELVFEVIAPFVLALVSAWAYFFVDRASAALDSLADILPSAISILIGFSVMFITLLLTSDAPAIEQLKDTSTDNKIRGENINLYQKLHIQLTESLFAEVLLLLAVFGYLFIKGVGITSVIEAGFLVIETYLMLHILLSIIRSTTHLYCVFYKDTKRNHQ